jgi:ribose 5-phosphate isomerase RpiB
MRIALGSDHAGFETKSVLPKLLRELGHQVLDVGTNSAQPVEIVTAYIGAKFSNEERHVRRLCKVKAMEARFQS